MCYATDARAVGHIITIDATRCFKSFTILTEVERTVKVKVELSLVYQMKMSSLFYRITVCSSAIGIFVFIAIVVLVKMVWYLIIISNMFLIQTLPK